MDYPAIIKQLTEELLDIMGFDGGVEIERSLFGREDTGEVLVVNVETRDSSILIGERGVNLFALQHLLRILVRAKIKEAPPFILDINDYRKRRGEFLKRLARGIADEVQIAGREVELQPMPAFERRIVHLELASRTDVVTESVGEGAGRRVVIKPMSRIDTDL